MSQAIAIGPTCALTLAKQQAGLIAATMRRDSPLITLPRWVADFAKGLGSGTIVGEHARDLLTKTAREIQAVSQSLKPEEARRVVRLIELLTIACKERTCQPQ